MSLTRSVTTYYKYIPFRGMALCSVKDPKGRPIPTPSAYSTHEGGYKIYKSLALYVAFPLIGALMLKSFLTHKEAERPEYVEYEYMRRRTKRFPWGEGQKSLFHNPKTNALPGGYEDC